MQAYNKSIQELVSLRESQGYNAAVYTQLSDVEGELNGFFSYDRAEAKVDIKALAEIHKTLLWTGQLHLSLQHVVHTCETE